LVELSPTIYGLRVTLGVTSSIRYFLPQFHVASSLIAVPERARIERSAGGQLFVCWSPSDAGRKEVDTFECLEAFVDLHDVDTREPERLTAFVESYGRLGVCEHLAPDSWLIPPRARHWSHLYGCGECAELAQGEGTEREPLAEWAQHARQVLHVLKAARILDRGIEIDSSMVEILAEACGVYSGLLSRQRTMIRGGQVAAESMVVQTIIQADDERRAAARLSTRTRPGVSYTAGSGDHLLWLDRPTAMIGQLDRLLADEHLFRVPQLGASGTTAVPKSQRKNFARRVCETVAAGWISQAFAIEAIRPWITWNSGDSTLKGAPEVEVTSLVGHVALGILGRLMSDRYAVCSVCEEEYVLSDNNRRPQSRGGNTCSQVCRKKKRAAQQKTRRSAAGSAPDGALPVITST
jgi:hypothetical protein